VVQLNQNEDLDSTSIQDRKHSIYTALSLFKYKLQNFSHSELSTGRIVSCLLALIISCALATTQSLTNPFSNLSVIYITLISVFFVFLGHYYSIQLSMDNRWKLIVFYLPIISILLLIMSAIGSIQLDNIESIFGYFIAFQISLLSGICSGEMSNAKWLGNALFMRHVNGVLKENGISYMYWNTDGNVSIIDPTEINPRWSASSDSVIFRMGDKVIPFCHLCPVTIRGSKISSALNDVLLLFDRLTVTWKNALAVYKQTIIDGEIRITWINFIQVTIIQNPQSISTHNSKVPAKSQRIKVDSTSMILSWRHPENDWDYSNRTIFNSRQENSALHSALMSEKETESILEVEKEMIIDVAIEDNELNVRILSLRSYYNLFVLLHQDISGKALSRSEVSKHCIKAMSNWFRTIHSDLTLFEISKLEIFSSSRCLKEFTTLNQWEQKLSDGIIDPVSIFMDLHDKLLNYVDEENLPAELASSIRTIVTSVQKEVIISNTRAPAANKVNSEIAFGSRRELGLNRKGIILSGICKMYFIDSLLSISKGGRS
jgi:hypothetical protein